MVRTAIVRWLLPVFPGSHLEAMSGIPSREGSTSDLPELARFLIKELTNSRDIPGGPEVKNQCWDHKGVPAFG